MGRSQLTARGRELEWTGAVPGTIAWEEDGGDSSGGAGAH